VDKFLQPQLSEVIVVEEINLSIQVINPSILDPDASRAIHCDSDSDSECDY